MTTNPTATTDLIAETRELFTAARTQWRAANRRRKEARTEAARVDARRAMRFWAERWNAHREALALGTLQAPTPARPWQPEPCADPECALCEPDTTVYPAGWYTWGKGFAREVDVDEDGRPFTVEVLR